MRQCAAVLVALGLAAVTVAAQSAGGWTVPRTPDGRPDLQGVWANNGITPMTRPTQWKDKGPTLSNAEVEDLKKTLAKFVDQGGDAIFGNIVQLALNAKDTGKFDQTSYDPTTGNYNQFWMADRDVDNRTSLIIDPPDGQFPALTPEGEARRKLAVGRRQVVVEGSESGPRGPADGPEDRPLSERCITYGVPRLQANYNSYLQITQSPETVSLYQEMIHEARMVNLNGAPHLPANVRQLHGDPRGHWEGDTLVVETTNYVNGFQGSSPDVKLTERFTRPSADYLNWTITVDDPKTWTKPWTFMLRLKHADEQVYEYACHEGNISMTGILAGARADERRAAQAAAKRAAAAPAAAKKP
ncbi:MAG: hypothetical protein ABMA15_12225 [Vicinamibacterales bacterium]